ncbi:MAG: Na+/H+ antiporter [Actinobacteria bacterium]|nr:MAG: Na+/H+ antiporter [Actinomycetota bacterium]
MRSSPRACRGRRTHGWTRFRRSRTCGTTLDPAVATFGAHEELQLLLLLLTALALLLLADPLRIPYPILLVVGGLILGFAPGVPTVVLPPDAVIVGILPPLLYSAAFNTGLRDLKRNVRAISLLAIALVTVTMVAVAVAAHYVIGLSWSVSFVLGAVVSPTDPIAATSIAHRLGVPRRAIAIVEGESLVNDGTALVLFKFAAAAVVVGSFSLVHAAGDFVWTVLGGIAVGLVIGRVIRFIRFRVNNPPLEVTIAFLTGYIAFLPAAALGVSGVLAVVTAGVYMGWHTPELTTVDTRLQGDGFWAIFNFLLNALLFGLVGLQLQPILDQLHGLSWEQLVGYAALLWLVVVGMRFACGFPIAHVPRWLSRSLRERDPTPPWQFIAFIGWAGMRGGVTLAAALAIPLETDAGASFPDRSLVVFLAFSIVLSTLVIQGLSLPAVVRLLKLERDDLDEREDAKARIHAVDAGLARLEELIDEDWVRDETAERVRGMYTFRRNRFGARLDGSDEDGIEARSQDYQRLRRELLEAERGAVLALRNEGKISEDVMQRVTRDLDLEDSRLDV